MSCYGTAPAAESAQCFRGFLGFFPFLVEVLLPPTVRVSCPVSILQRRSHGSCFLHGRAVGQWSPGYPILIRLCRIVQAFTMTLTVEGRCCIVVGRTWKRFARIPKAFSTTPWRGLVINILSSLSRPLWQCRPIMVSRRAKASSPMKK